MAGIQPYRYPVGTPTANNMATNLGMTYRFLGSTPTATNMAANPGVPYGYPESSTPATSNMAANLGMNYRYPESTSAATNMAANPGMTYRYPENTPPYPPSTTNMVAISGMTYRHSGSTAPSSPALTNMAANAGMSYGYSGSTPATTNMATGMRPFQQPESSPACPPGSNTLTNPCQSYSTVEMGYCYFKLEAGMTEPVLVTQISGPHHFVCQLRSRSQDVQRLAESMHQFYNAQKAGGDGGLQPPLALGQPYASCASDGRWYRSLLQDFFLDKQLAMVIHVDWARKEIVPLSGLRTLAAEFFRMPVVTFPCAMYGIPNGELGWDLAFLTEFRSVLFGRPLSAKIEWYNSYEHLYVVTLFAEDGMNLNCFFKMRAQSPKVCQIKMPSATETPEDETPTEQTPQSSYVSKFPPVELKTSKFYDAVVVYVIDPFNFWVRLKMYAAEHKEMVDGMTMLYSPASKLEGIIAKPEPGQLCCARYQDLYYRAEVISVVKKQVKVYLLDNGITETVDFYHIKELPGKFTKLQALANKCSLADTYPVKDTWSKEAIRAFKVAVTDRNLVIHVVSKDADEYTIEVQDQCRIEERCVGKILANAGLARYEELDSGDEIIACVESAKILRSPSVADPVPEVQEIVDSDLDEDNAEALQFSPFEDQLFEPGSKIEVVVSCIDNPGVFWCQNARFKADLCSLMEAIKSYCKSTNCPYTSDTLACLALSPRDDIWYRAFITKVPVNLSKTSTAQVLYVDYGMRETVPVANLQALNSDFLHLKAQAFKCSLYNIIHPKGDDPFLWDSEATEVLMEFVQKASMWTEFDCFFYASASLDKKVFHIVDLSTPFANVSDKLVERGYATSLQHKTLAPSVQLLTYYSMPDFKLGSELEIYVTHVDSTLLFYGQLARSSDTLEKIASTITKVVEKTQKLKSPPKCGALCLAKYSDQQWYRGIQYENGSNKVFFVDFGNTEKLTKEDLLPIRSREHNLLLLPMQAVKFSLADIPADVSGEIVYWFEEAVLGKALKARIVAKDADGKLTVELYDGKQQINTVLKSKFGVRVIKDKPDYPAAYQPKIFKQEDSRKLTDNVSNQEKKPPFSVGKNIKSREPDIRSQEPESRYRKNPTVQHKAENKDCDSRFISQRRTETVQRVSSSDSYQGRDGKPPSDSYQGRDGKPPSDSYQGRDGKPPNASYQGRDGKPPNASYQGRDGKPPNASYQGRDGNPPNASYQGRDGNPPNASYQGRDGNPPNASYQGRDGNPPNASYQGRDGNPPNASYLGRDGKPPNASYQGRDGKPPNASYQGRDGKPPNASYQGSFGGRDTKQVQSKTLSQKQSSTSPVKPPELTLSDIPRREIFPGMKEEVYVSHTNSIFDFYVQVAEDSSLDEMSEILNNEKSSFEELGDEEIHAGNVICAYFPDDGLYYRGVVTGKSRQGVCVQYIDYGNTSVISDCKNYRLPQKCRSVPATSIHCSLDKPKNVIAAPDLQEILVEFSKRTSDVQLDCEFRKQDGLKWHVILKDEMGCVNDLLTAAEELVLEKGIEEADERVMKMAEEEESSSVSTFTWNLPQPGVTIKVFVSVTYGPECFWCQLSAADIDSLASQVQEAGEQSVKNEDFIGALDIGSPCNVIFSEDNNWYRAVVTKMEAELVTVRFIDYGNEDSVTRDQIQQLPEALVKIPAQAFPCCLADLEMKAGAWTPEAINYFYEKVTEDVLELTVCEIRESGSCPIPVACVTAKCNELNISEDMRKFWQEGQIRGLKLPDESMNSSPDDENKTEEADQPHGYRESPTTDSRASEPGESAPEGQCEDRPQQMDMIGDVFCPHHAEKPESDTDGVKETAGLHLKVHVDLAADDSDQALLGKRLPQEESELLTRDTSESLESLILHFNEKLVLLNEDAMSDDAPKEEVTAQSEISEEITIVTGAETAEQFEDCIEGGTIQENEGGYVEREDLLTSSNDVESEEMPPSNDGMEEAVCREEECGRSLGIEALDTNHFAASVDLDTAREAAISIVTQEGEIGTIGCADAIVVTNDAEGTDVLIAIEESEMVVASENVTEDDIVKSKVSAELLEIEPEEDVLILQDEAIEEDVQSYSGLVICGDGTSEDVLEIEDPLDSEAVAEGEEGPAGKDYGDTEAIFAECFSEVEETVATEHFGNVTSKETVQSEEELTSCDVSECGRMTIIDFEEVIQEDEEVVLTEGAIKLAGEDLECRDLMNLEEAVTEEDLEFKDAMNHEESVDSEEVDLKDRIKSEEAVSEEDLDLKDTMKLEEAVTDDDLEFKDTMNLEEAVTDDDLEFKDCMNLEEALTDDDLKLKDRMSHEESVDGEEVDLKDRRKSEEAVACEDEESEEALGEQVFYESLSTDFNDHEEPEIVQGFVESVKAESCRHVVKVLLAETSKDCVQSEEDLTSYDVSECGQMTTIDFEEVIQEDEEVVSAEGAIKGSGEDMELKYIMNRKEAVTDADLEPKDSINREESLDSEDIVECGVVTATDCKEVIQDDEEVVSTEGAIEEARSLKLFEEFEDTIVEGSLTDLSQDFVAGADKVSVAGEDMKLKDSMSHEEAVYSEDLELKDHMSHEEAVYAEGLELKDSMESEEAVYAEDMELKDSMKSEEAVYAKDMEFKDHMSHEEALYAEGLELKDHMSQEEAVYAEGLELKDSTSHEEAVYAEGIEVKDHMSQEEAVYAEDMELKDHMSQEEAVYAEDMELKDHMSHEEALYAEGLELKDHMSQEEAVYAEGLELKDSTSHEEALYAEGLELKDHMSQEEAVYAEGLELKDSTSHEEAVYAEGIEVKDHMSHEEALYSEDLELKDSMSHEEALYSEGMELKDSTSHEEALYSEGKELKDHMSHEETVYAEGLELKDSTSHEEAVYAEGIEVKDHMSHEEAINAEDLELKDSMSHEEAVYAEDLELKDHMSHEEALYSEDLELKDSMSHEKALYSEGMELKDSTSHEEALYSEGKELKDHMSHEETVYAEGLDLKDSTSHEEAVYAEGIEVKDHMSHEEAINAEDLELKDSMSHEEAVYAEGLELKDSMKSEEAVTDKNVDLKDSTSHEEAVYAEDMELKDSVNSEEAVYAEDMELKDSVNSEEAVVREDLETKVAAFEEVLCESLSTDLINDPEEPELVQGLVGSSRRVVDCGRDVFGQREDLLPADDSDMSPPGTEQDEQPDSFTVYRECPMLIASADSVYWSDLNDLLEKTDSDSDSDASEAFGSSSVVEVSGVTATEESVPGGKEMNPEP